MPTREFGQRSIRWRLVGFGLSDFSGGLNLRDSSVEIDSSETPDSVNWTLDTRGALKFRNGCGAGATALPGTTGKAARLFRSDALGVWLCMRESAGAYHLFTNTSAFPYSGSWTDRGALLGNIGIGTHANAVDWPGATPLAVLALSSAGGNSNVYTWDGTTLTNVGIAQNVQGNSIAVWQNRVWIGGYPVNNASGNLTRLFASKIGDPATWATPDGLTVDIRDRDAAQITGLGVAGGALVVFKARSAYRVNDSATGAYTTIDPAAGVLNHRSVVSVRGRLYTWGADNIYEWNGVGPGVPVGDKILPLLTSQVGGTTLSGGVLANRLLFTYSLSGTAPDGIVEFDPQRGWSMQHALANSAINEISSFASDGSRLYGAIQDGDVVYSIFSGTVGLDGGGSPTLPANYFRTKWIEPAGGMFVRINRLQIEGSLVTGGTNTLTLNLYKDGDFTTPVGTWNLSTALRLASATHASNITEVFPRIKGRSFALEVVAGTASGAAQVTSITADALLVGLR